MDRLLDRVIESIKNTTQLSEREIISQYKTQVRQGLAILKKSQIGDSEFVDVEESPDNRVINHSTSWESSIFLAVIILINVMLVYNFVGFLFDIIQYKRQARSGRIAGFTLPKSRKQIEEEVEKETYRLLSEEAKRREVISNQNKSGSVCEDFGTGNRPLKNLEEIFEILNDSKEDPSDFASIRNDKQAETLMNIPRKYISQ